ERIPQYVRILIGVALGIIAGLQLPHEWTSSFNELGMLVIRFLKALATPLILFAVLDAFLRTHIPASKGAKLIGISLMNAAVAIVIGLGVANLLRTGDQWKGRLDKVAEDIKKSEPPTAVAADKEPKKEPAEKPSLGVLRVFSSYI